MLYCGSIESLLRQCEGVMRERCAHQLLLLLLLLLLEGLIQ
jgi:hypothetical protein